MAVIDKDYLTDTQLFGVRLTDSDNNAFPDAFFTRSIESAQDRASRRLGIPLGDADYVTFTDEQHDHEIGRTYQFYLQNGPVRAITQVQMAYGTDTIGAIPTDWFNVVDPKTGLVQLVPTTGNIAWEFTRVYAALWGPFRLNGVFRFTYTAGYKSSDVPESIKEIVAMEAAIPILRVAGELILGAGIASQSIGVDGMSTSIGTTSSATNNGFGASIIELQKALKDRYKVLRDSERGPVFAVA